MHDVCLAGSFMPEITTHGVIDNWEVIPITTAMSFSILAPTPPATNEWHLQGNMLHYHYEVIQAH